MLATRTTQWHDATAKLGLPVALTVLVLLAWSLKGIGIGGLIGGAILIPTYENSHIKLPGDLPAIEAPAHPPPTDNPHREFIEIPVRDLMTRSMTPSNILPEPKFFRDGERWILRIPRS